MSRRKKTVVLLLAIALVVGALFTLSACADSKPVFNQELITNGGFELWEEDDGFATGWQRASLNNSRYTTTKKQFDKSGGVAEVPGVSDPQNYGDYHLTLENTSQTSSWVYQTIPVSRGYVYKISVSYRMTTAATPGEGGSAVGAHITVLENEEIKLGALVNGSNNWQEATFYVEPKNTNFLTIALKIGSEDQPTKAKADFDKVSVQCVETIPSGTSVTEIRKLNTFVYNNKVGGDLFVALFCIFGFAILIVAYIMIRRLFSSKYALSADPEATGFKKLLSNTVFLSVAVIGITFVIRLIFALTMYGFGAETAKLISIGESLIAKGTTMFYVNNPTDLTSPGALYILSIVGGLGKLFGLESGSMGYAILLKMPAIIADMGAVAIIFFFGRKYVGNKMAAIYSAIYALLPVAFVLSGIRGSFDSILAALLLLTFVLLIEKKYIWMFVSFFFALLLSLNAMAAAPLILANLIYLIYKARRDGETQLFKKLILTTVIGCVAVFVALYLFSLPFTFEYVAGTKDLVEKSQPFYVLTKYADMMRNVKYFVSNGFNLYGMVGMNGNSVNNTAAIFNLIFILVLLAYVISLYAKNRNRLELMLLGSFTFTIISVFTLKNTETYMFLALAMLLAYIMISGEKRLYFVFVCLSLLSFLNIAQLMNISGFVASHPTGPVVNYESVEVFYIFMSVLTLLVTLFYGYLTYVICNNDNRMDIPPMRDKWTVTLKDWFKSVKQRYFKKVN